MHRQVPEPCGGDTSISFLLLKVYDGIDEGVSRDRSAKSSLLHNEALDGESQQRLAFKHVMLLPNREEVVADV